jgi:hypothetical protein
VSVVQGKSNGSALLRHNNAFVVRHEGLEQLPISLIISLARQHARVHYNPLLQQDWTPLFQRALRTRSRVINPSQRATFASYCQRVHSLLTIFTLKMEAIRFFEMSILTKDTTTFFMKRTVKRDVCVRLPSCNRCLSDKRAGFKTVGNRHHRESLTSQDQLRHKTIEAE